MPPTFPYFLAFSFWVPMALLVWLSAGLLFLRKKTRTLAKSLALGMAGTFPGVFFYQLIALPIIAFLLLVVNIFAWCWGLFFTSNPPNFMKAAIGVPIFLTIFFLMVSSSCIGFYEGLRAGWRIGTGSNFREAMKGGPLFEVWQKIRWAKQDRHDMT